MSDNGCSPFDSCSQFCGTLRLAANSASALDMHLTTRTDILRRFFASALKRRLSLWTREYGIPKAALFQRGRDMFICFHG